MIKAHSSAVPEQLNLEVGQLILIFHKNPSGWWLGELQVDVELIHFISLWGNELRLFTPLNVVFATN